MPDSDFLAALREGGVEFTVVGGLAAVLNGAPVKTSAEKSQPAQEVTAIGVYHQDFVDL